MTPVGPRVPLGTVAGATVSLASANGVNEVWVDATRHEVPTGKVIHQSLNGSVVDLWVEGASVVSHWTLDAATGVVATKVLTGTIRDSSSSLYLGAPGFWIDVPAAGLFDRQLYNWDGTYVTRDPGANYRATQVGFTADHAVTRGYGQTATVLEFHPMSTAAVQGQEPVIVKAISGGFLMGPSSCDAAGCTYTLNDGRIARIEPDKDIVYFPKP